MPYLIDSDVFIQAKNLHYGFDFCPAFWDWIVAANTAGTVFSVQKIRSELAAGNDDLAAWAAARGAGFFLPPDAAVMASVGALSTWAAAPATGYTQAAQQEFLASGDLYLIAHARAHGYIVVTHEVGSNTSRKVKIPTACAAMGVQCISPFTMLRAEAASFVLLGAAAAPAAAAGVTAPTPGIGSVVAPSQGTPAP